MFSCCLKAYSLLYYIKLHADIKKDILETVFCYSILCISFRELLFSLKNNILNEKSCVVFIDNIDVVCPKKDSDATYAVRELIKCLVRTPSEAMSFLLTPLLATLSTTRVALPFISRSVQSPTGLLRKLSANEAGLVMAGKKFNGW